MTEFNGRTLDQEEEAHQAVFDPEKSGQFCLACGIETLDAIHDPANYHEELAGFHAAKAHARRLGCYCGDYPTHLCPYHEGYYDGFDAGRDAA